MKIECITLSAFQVNAYVLEDPVSGDVALIDTGFDGQLAQTLAAAAPPPQVKAILLTHAHFDHAGGLTDLQQQYPEAVTYLPAMERTLFETLPKQGELIFGVNQFNRPCGRIDREVRDGDEVNVGTLKFRFIATPGHTPGQGCYYTEEATFVGDTLFAGSVGRTDFPMSDAELATESLRRLMDLPGHLKVYSGHGPVTTLEQELYTNPFLDYLRRERGIAATRTAVGGTRRWT
ncbi:MAG: MBL fold metallo-hydrolase [Candidatus Competibacteraceae bacterium]|jgi:glyoxylase-like metal-dependent hydrolase (beta-lactamase superfamily II)|nr:MBL fold metallo-hydrolase [Candidatus Competibacteraceae bacterium]